MPAELFSREKVNTGRQKEADLLKAFSIFMMILTHCIDELLVYDDAVFPVLVNDILAQSVGAQGFMICMGIGVVYGRRATGADYLKRGISLLVTGQFLNLIRYVVPAVITYALTGDDLARSRGFWCISSDILQFAGLFFICLALFYRLKLDTPAIFGISAALSILATFVRGSSFTGIYAVDQLIGLFFFTETESYFPLFHWMIFPASGMLFAELLMRVKDKKKFYSLLLIPAAAASALYFSVGLLVDQPVFTAFTVWQSFCYVNLLEALAQLFPNLFMICVCFFVTHHMSERAFRPVSFVSKNINRYYCIHSVLIYWLWFLFHYVFHPDPENEPFCYVMTLGIFLLTTLLVLWYDRKWQGPVRSLLGKHRILLYGIVLLLTLVSGVFCYRGITEFPNLTNEYLEG